MQEKTFTEDEIVEINKAKEAGKNFPYPERWDSLSVLEMCYYFEYRQWVISGKNGEAPTLKIEKDNLPSVVFVESSNAVKSELAAEIPEATELEIAAVTRPKNQQLPVSKIPRFQRSITQLSLASSSSGISSASPTNSQDKNLEFKITKKEKRAVDSKVDFWNRSQSFFPSRVSSQLGDDPNLNVHYKVDCRREENWKFDREEREDNHFIKLNKLNVSKGRQRVSASVPNTSLLSGKIR